MFFDFSINYCEAVRVRVFPACFFPAFSRLHLGLDLGPHHLRLALLRHGPSLPRWRRRPRQPHCLALGEQHFPDTLCEQGRIGDLHTVIDHCRGLLHGHALAGARLFTALPASAVHLRMLVLPARADAVQRLAQVRAALADEIAGHSGDPWLDFRVCGPVPASPGDVQVQAAAVPRLLVEDRMAIAAGLGMPLGGLCLAESCLDDARHRTPCPTSCGPAFRLAYALACGAGT